MDIISSNNEDTIKELAQESMKQLEPICQSCWDDGKDDPLGLYNGVNTRYNKVINAIVDKIIESHSEADYMWYSEIREDLIDIFYQERRNNFQDSKRRVHNKLECYYCFLERKQNEDELSIRISDIIASDLLNKEPKDWL